MGGTKHLDSQGLEGALKIIAQTQRLGLSIDVPKEVLDQPNDPDSKPRKGPITGILYVDAYGGASVPGGYSSPITESGEQRIIPYRD